MSFATWTRTNKIVPEPRASGALRPWHFLLFAVLITATMAVMLSRQATSERLILISFTMIAAGLTATAFYRILSPPAASASDVTMFSEPATDAPTPQD